MSEKEYIGDGVYVQFDGYGILLTTERYDGRGQAATHYIFLEPEVFQSLANYAARVWTTERVSRKKPNE